MTFGARETRIDAAIIRPALPMELGAIELCTGRDRSTLSADLDMSGGTGAATGGATDVFADAIQGRAGCTVDGAAVRRMKRGVRRRGVAPRRTARSASRIRGGPRRHLTGRTGARVRQNWTKEQR